MDEERELRNLARNSEYYPEAAQELKKRQANTLRNQITTLKNKVQELVKGHLKRNSHQASHGANIYRAVDEDPKIKKLKQKIEEVETKMRRMYGGRRKTRRSNK